jgi:GAF domain-containing protein
MIAVKPDNEARRLAALKEYRILDTESEQAYDDLTALAAFVCQVPVAMVSLVDDARQWFKSRVGINEQETPRDVAFCAHAILQTEPLVVRDALKDLRFADSALVTRSPNIRFYAGFPLSTPDGLALGTLCAIDRKPRQLTDAQITAMQALSRQVMVLLEFRRISGHMAEALENVKTLKGLLPICAWCKRIRDDQGYWNQVEAYMHEQTGVDFTHGICPDCMKQQSAGRGKTKSTSKGPVPGQGNIFGRKK